MITWELDAWRIISFLINLPALVVSPLCTPPLSQLQLVGMGGRVASVFYRPPPQSYNSFTKSGRALYCLPLSVLLRPFFVGFSLHFFCLVICTRLADLLSFVNIIQHCDMECCKLPWWYILNNNRRKKGAVLSLLLRRWSGTPFCFGWELMPRSNMLSGVS